MGKSVCSEKYDVYSEFDLEKHKKTYVDYLEVMIGEGGDVHYAVPSHQEYAIWAACQKLGVTRYELCSHPFVVVVCLWCLCSWSADT